jgi:transposase-like protein
MLRRVALVRTDVSEELSSSFIRVTRIGELGTTLAVRSLRRLLVTASVVPSSRILVTLMKEALSSSETSVFTRATRHNIPEDVILHSNRRVLHKYYSIDEFCIV